MFQENINGNTTSSKPFLTADGWVWFRGTNNILWRVFNDGSKQSRPGDRMIWTTPFVTADGWVWFQDIDYKLYRMKTDGSDLSTPGNAAKYTANLVPLVTDDGWVWFCGNNGKGNNDALYRMRTDGSQKSTPGDNSALSTPFVTADGWVWFRGTDSKLYRMRPDGRDKSTPGNNATRSTPFVTADGWVWFQGTDDGLNRMKTDGSDKSQPGKNATKSTPLVTADGWVWFQGMDNGLNRMRTDGSLKTIVDNNATLSTPVVGPMSAYKGVAGEWVYWRGTNNALWRDLVPASALRTEAGQPAYYILTAVYSPPGTTGGDSGSYVEYASGSSTGTITSTSESFKAQTKVGASGGGIGVNYSASRTDTDASALKITKSESYTFRMPGPAVDGINHDYDLFELLLNPLVTAQEYPQDVVLWNMGVHGSKGAAILEVYVGWLNGHMEMPKGTKAALDARGLTQKDYDQILSANPFAAGSGTIDPNRFIANGQQFPYSPPPTPEDKPTERTRECYSGQEQTSSHKVTTQYTVDMEVNISFLKNSSKFTWTSENTTEKSDASSQRASVRVGGPSYGYEGPVQIVVYWDTVYRSFMFALPTTPPSYTGILRDESGQPVAYQPVTLTVGGKVFSTFTDGLGEYRFYGTPSGQGTIDAGRQQIAVEVDGDRPSGP
jgi:Domain of unknown function (DUF5050)